MDYSGTDRRLVSRIVMRGGGYGLLGNIVVGIVGALIGGFWRQRCLTWSLRAST